MIKDAVPSSSAKADHWTNILHTHRLVPQWNSKLAWISRLLVISIVLLSKTDVGCCVLSFPIFVWTHPSSNVSAPPNRRSDFGNHRPLLRGRSLDVWPGVMFRGFGGPRVDSKLKRRGKTIINPVQSKGSNDSRFIVGRITLSCHGSFQKGCWLKNGTWVSNEARRQQRMFFFEKGLSLYMERSFSINTRGAWTKVKQTWVVYPSCVLLNQHDKRGRNFALNTGYLAQTWPG